MTGGLTTESASDFPTPNVGPSALPWARAVSQRIAKLEDQERLDATRIADLNRLIVQVLRRAGVAAVSTGGADSSVYTHSRILTQGASGTTYDNTDASSNFFGVENNTNPAFATATFWGPASVETQVMDLDGGRMTDVAQEFGSWQLSITDDVGATHEMIYADQYGTLRLLGQPYTPGGGGGGSSLPAGTAMGQVLTWSGTAWGAVAPPTELPATATSGQYLEFNGTAWVAATIPQQLPASASDGQIPVWSTQASAWVARNPTTGSTALANLTDVDESTGPHVGDVLAWNGSKWAPAPSSGFTRQAATYTTATLAVAANEVGLIPLAQGYRIYRVAVSAPARVRLYDTIGHRDADRARNTSTAIDRTTDTGLMLDMALDSVLAMTCAPLVDGVNFEAGAGVPITVDNLGSGSVAVTVTLTFVRTE